MVQKNRAKTVWIYHVWYKRFLSVDTRITKQRIKICPRVHRYHQQRHGNYLPCS